MTLEERFRSALRVEQGLAVRRMTLFGAARIVVRMVSAFVQNEFDRLAARSHRRRELTANFGRHLVVLGRRSDKQRCVRFVVLLLHLRATAGVLGEGGTKTARQLR